MGTAFYQETLEQSLVRVPRIESSVQTGMNRRRARKRYSCLWFLALAAVSVNRFRKPVAAPVAATKECVYCGPTIPMQAIRCPECTSDLKLVA